MKIRNLVLTNHPANERHPQLGLPSVGKGVCHAGMHPLLHVAVWFTSLVLITLTLFLMGRLFLLNNWLGGWESIGVTLGSNLFWSAVAVGFFAQAVDGALGMAYGTTSTTFLLANVLSKAFRRLRSHMQAPRHVGKLALFGGLFTAPFAAMPCRKISARALVVLVGTLIIILSFFNLYRALIF